MSVDVFTKLDERKPVTLRDWNDQSLQAQLMPLKPSNCLANNPVDRNVSHPVM